MLKTRSVSVLHSYVNQELCREWNKTSTDICVPRMLGDLWFAEKACQQQRLPSVEERCRQIVTYGIKSKHFEWFYKGL
jgi:hypothetical protein